MSACLLVAIYHKFKLNKQIRIFQICACACYSSSNYNLAPHRWIYWMWQRTPHHVTQCRWIYWVWETNCERKGLLLARLQRRRQKEQEQRRSEHSRFIGMELVTQFSCISLLRLTPQCSTFSSNMYYTTRSGLAFPFSPFFSHSSPEVSFLKPERGDGEIEVCLVGVEVLVATLQQAFQRTNTTLE